MEMLIRPSVTEDIPSIMEIITANMAYLKENAIDQWQNGYPNAQSIQMDIDQGQSYVLLKNNTIVATVALVVGPEADYDQIQGAWLQGGNYMAIHRIAVAPAAKGQDLGKKLLTFAGQLAAEKNLPALRVDTHADNQVMRGLLQSTGFTYCGEVYITDAGDRLAFEKMVQGNGPVAH